jgi:hypothetical protein
MNARWRGYGWEITWFIALMAEKSCGLLTVLKISSINYRSCHMTDRFGSTLNVGDQVVYMTANTWTGLTRGRVMEVYERRVVVLGEGNTKAGELTWEKRIYKLPESC